jgi:hypothetical protein
MKYLMFTPPLEPEVNKMYKMKINKNVPIIPENVLIVPWLTDEFCLNDSL